MEIELPDEFDLSYYRAANSDLGTLSDNDLFRHYVVYGQKEGRSVSPGASRESLLELIAEDALILEIGPFCNPVCTGRNVRYFDVLDSEGLRERAREHDLDISRCPERIHYVSETGDLSVVQERFDVIFSSHCIEHQPNIVKHLRDAYDILKDGGYYFLFIPDKRYCFDHFIPESTIADLVEADVQCSKLHVPRSLVNHALMTTHNEPGRHWAGDHGRRKIDEDASIVASAIDQARRYDEKYIDVHAWQFTPDSFRSAMAFLFTANICPLRLERVYATRHGSNEFSAIMRKP